MGIDATAVCTALPKGWLSRMSGPKALQAIPKLATNWATTQGLGPLCQTAVLPDGTLQVELVPIAEPLRFTATADRLTASFRSSGMGPGYHRAAVALLDHLAEKMKFSWRWTATDGTPLDETGYGQTRDTAALEAAMLAFLRNLGRIAQTSIMNDEASAVALCIPMGLGRENGKIACPMGYQPQDWAGELSEMDDAALLTEAKAFFPWWDVGLGGATLETLLRALLWQNAEWRLAMSASDQLTLSQIDHLRLRLQALGHPLPQDLQTALRDLEACQLTEDAPAPEGIGYRKQLIYQQIFKSWSIERPGYAWPVENGDNAAWEHFGFWMGAAALTFAPDQIGPTPFLWPKHAVGTETEIRPGISYRLTAVEHSESGGKLQQAFILSKRDDCSQLLVLTLSSHLDWPYEAFPSWIATVSCPDLPATAPFSPEILSH